MTENVIENDFVVSTPALLAIAALVGLMLLFRAIDYAVHIAFNEGRKAGLLEAGNGGGDDPSRD